MPHSLTQLCLRVHASKRRVQVTKLVCPSRKTRGARDALVTLSSHCAADTGRACGYARLLNRDDGTRTRPTAPYSTCRHQVADARMRVFIVLLYGRTADEIERQL
eukprot:7649020-Alexandrium_andersonii.AAC.1